MLNKSKERAWEIIKILCDKFKGLDFIKSVILVGSLSDDTYTGYAGSDIDLVIIINTDNYIKMKKYIIELIISVEVETNHDLPISKTIYEYRDLFHPYRYDYECSIENKDLIEKPIEILRIKDSGKTIYGEEIIDKIEMPTKEDILKYHKLSDLFNENMTSKDPIWYENYLKTLENPSCRLITQIVLTNAMSDYYLITGKNCSSKFRILECIEKDITNFEYLNLLKLSHKWRFHNSYITQEDKEIMHNDYQKIFRKRKKYY